MPCGTGKQLHLYNAKELQSKIFVAVPDIL